jgi:hypothetical protein
MRTDTSCIQNFIMINCPLKMAALRGQKNRINYKYQSGDPPADAGC